jgi:hypothetical protein
MLFLLYTLGKYVILRKRLSECLRVSGTYYTGNIIGAGYLYQQTFTDTYTKVGCCKLYDRKDVIGILNDKAMSPQKMAFTNGSIKFVKMNFT